MSELSAVSSADVSEVIFSMYVSSIVGGVSSERTPLLSSVSGITRLSIGNVLSGSEALWLSRGQNGVLTM